MRSVRRRGREKERERERKRLYPDCTGAAVEVVQALLVACSRTYTLDRIFDLGSRVSAEESRLGTLLVTDYLERTENPCKGNSRNDLLSSIVNKVCALIVSQI